ncbi:hypothetical protein BY996DRAFT_3992582 [Phakopsora pachyrhizi]|nr:hypothetical protein BY996DRAFT_3992582 [Phakopsora pachyrhizi]
MQYLHQMVNDYFTECAIFKISLWDQKTDQSKAFEIPIASLARFFHVFFEAGAVSMSPSLHNPVELLLVQPIIHHNPESSVRTPVGTRHLGYALECEDCTWSIKYRQGVKVDIPGKFSANMFKFGVVTSQPEMH